MLVFSERVALRDLKENLIHGMWRIPDVDENTRAPEAVREPFENDCVRLIQERIVGVKR